MGWKNGLREGLVRKVSRRISIVPLNRRTAFYYYANKTFYNIALKTSVWSLSRDVKLIILTNWSQYPNLLNTCKEWFGAWSIWLHTKRFQWNIKRLQLYLFTVIYMNCFELHQKIMLEWPLRFNERHVKQVHRCFIFDSHSLLGIS